MTQTNKTPTRGFSTSEFEQRTAAAQALMAAQSLDALFLTTEPEFRYFTGFHSAFWQSPTRPWFLVIPAEGKPVAIVPEIGKPSLQSTWLDDVRTWLAPQPEDDGVSLLVEVMKEMVGVNGRIGVPMGHETHIRMAAKDFDRVRSLLDNRQFVDGTNIVRSLRMVKSEAEIEKVARMCFVASNAFDNFSDVVKCGDTEREAFSKFRIELMRQGADEVPFLVGSSGPDGFSDVIKQPSDRILTKGDLIVMDTGALFDGYSCDFDRNFAFGHASDDAKCAYDLAYRATEAALAIAQPGITSSDLWRAMAKVLEDGGAEGHLIGRMGHGLGMQVTEWPSLMPGDNTVLEAGMVLTLEPGLAFGDGKMMLHEENFVMREDGAELLTRRAAAELPII